MPKAKWKIDPDTAVVYVNARKGTRNWQLFRLPKEIVTRLALLGLQEKLRDASAAKGKDPIKEGDRVYAQLSEGVWTRRVQEDIALLIRAVAELQFAGDTKAAGVALEKAGFLPQAGDDETTLRKRTAARRKLRQADGMERFFPKSKPGLADLLK